MRLQGMTREFDHQGNHYRIEADHVTDDPLTYDCHILRRDPNGSTYTSIDRLRFLPDNPEHAGQSDLAVDDAIRDLLEIAEERFVDPTAEVVNHLVAGGLLDLLRNHQGATVWLRRKEDGSFTHTFVDPKQGRPSAKVPFSSLDSGGTKVFSPHKAQVRGFLSAIGIPDRSIGAVLQRVGEGM